MSNPNYNTLITTTLQNFGREIFDNVSTNNALSFMLKKAGNIKIVPGGRVFTHPIIYKTNSSFQAYSKNDTISLATSDDITRAEYPIKVLAGSIALNTIDLAMNAGDREKLIDLAEEQKMSAEISMSELLGDQVFKDGSAANDFDGLQFLVNTAPSTQTDVGGIDPSDSANTYWRNYVDTTGTAAFNTSQAGIALMNTALSQTTFGRQGPKMVITTKAVYELYELGLQSQVRYTRTDLADAGFQTLEFKTMPVFFDDNCPTGKDTYCPFKIIPDQLENLMEEISIKYFSDGNPQEAEELQFA